jgi:hypothetical protein
LEEERVKGIIAFDAILLGLLAVGTSAYAIYFFLKTLVEIWASNFQAQSERNAIHLANALISSEKLVYEKDGIKYRGMLDEEKLNSVFLRSEKGFREKEELKSIFNRDKWIEFERLGLGYMNVITWVTIVDLDRCGKDNCVVWSGVTLGINVVNLIEESPQFKFLKCLYDAFDKSWGHLVKMAAACTAGAIVGSVIGGLAGAAIGCGLGIIVTLWTPEEIVNCFGEALPEWVKAWLEKGSPIVGDGLPINIVCKDGSVHRGRIVVSILEWIYKPTPW